MPIWQRAVVLVLLGAALAVGTPTKAQGEDDRRVLAALERIGASVEHFYARVRSVVADVQVRIQPMRRDMSPNGRVRRLFYEMRVEWEAGAHGEAPDPVVTRVLLEADGRPPDPG